jgi:AcrR family transcriptional regulator
MRKVKRDLVSARTGADAGGGRAAQRNRTRKAIIEAAMRLLETGGTPSVAEIAAEAEVSRRTVYMYFPTLEQLLIDATLGALSGRRIDIAIADLAGNDPVARVEELCRVLSRHTAETMQLGRALIRLTVEGDEPAAGGPRRGYRRVQWIEKALAPMRSRLRKNDFEQLVSALCVLIGWEPMIVLKDVRGLDQKAAEDVLAFAVGAVVEKALAAAHHRRG